MGGIERIRAPLLDVIEVLLLAYVGGIELHGWAIMKSARRSGPTTYRVLEKLEGLGYIRGTWEEANPVESKPRRRFYVLTDLGAPEVRRILQERRPQALKNKTTLEVQRAFGTLLGDVS